METHLEKTCHVCGSDSVGFQELLATCSRCFLTCEHLYCMRVLTFVMPDDWVCDSCLSENEMNLVESGAKEDTLMSSSNIAQHDTNTLLSHKRLTKSSWQFHSKKQKPVETGKVKFLNPDEVIALSSGATKLESPTKTIMSSGSGHSNILMSLCQKNPTKARTVNPRFFPERVGKATAYIHSGPSKPSSEGSVHKSPTSDKKDPRASKEIKERSPLQSGKWRRKHKQLIDICAPLKDAEASKDNDNFTEKSSSHAPLSPRSTDPETLRNADTMVTSENKKCDTPCPQLPSSNSPCGNNAGGKFNELAEDNCPNVEAEELLHMQDAIELYHTFFPSQHITWKGGFSVVDSTLSELIEGFQAQPPCRVHCKAYETSRIMPPVLQVKMLPQLHEAADLFGDGGADLADIALYFFASPDNTERSREMHYKLFEHMEARRSIMIGYVNDIELLIFTSKHLNVEFQNAFSSKTRKFFWGVFRKSEPSSVRSLAVNEEKLEASNIKSLEANEEKLEVSNVVSLCDGNAEKGEASKVNFLCNVNGEKREASDIIKSLCEVNEETVPMITPLACAYPNDQEFNVCEDMEIDMVGGQDVGRIDVVIHKDSPTWRSNQPISTKGNRTEKQIVVAGEMDSSIQQPSPAFINPEPKAEDHDKFMASWRRLQDLCLGIGTKHNANALLGFPANITGSSLGIKPKRN